MEQENKKSLFVIFPIRVPVNGQIGLVQKEDKKETLQLLEP